MQYNHRQYILLSSQLQKESPMKRKFLLTILVLLLIACVTFCLAACDLEGMGGQNGKDGADGIDGKDGLDGADGTDGKDGLSAYEIYKKYTKDNPALSEEEWLESLKGESGLGIKSVEIVCGSVIVTFTDNSTHTLEDALPEAGHDFDEGQTTTVPTCITPGIVTYDCKNCDATKKEVLDADDENHVYGNYENDKERHWQTCRLCGDVLTETHDFGQVSKDDDVDKKLSCKCGVSTTVGEFFSFKVTFECVGEASVLIYESQDYTVDGTSSDVAYARSKNGKLLNDGKGQVNFEAVFPFGYRVSISITPENGYANLEGAQKTGKENVYRLTDITSDLLVRVEAEVDALNLPVMVINTENAAPILDKENYVNCSVSVLNAESKYNFEGAEAGIRLRGNSSLKYDKKPYRIKFEKKQDLFGFGKYKSWVLLAMYQDFSNVKDYAAFSFAESIAGEGSAFVPHAQHVEVYLNGEYVGLYLLTEQVQENEGRVGVEAEFDGTLTEIPFLVECDFYAKDEGVEGVDWFRISNYDVECYYNIKYPEADQRYTQAQFDYVKNYIVTVNNLCYNAATTQAQFEQYVDLASFIDYYLIEEFMGQGDINWKSIFMSKTTDGKLVMGPVWDFDWAVGGPAHHDSDWSSEGWMSERNWFLHMMEKSWFAQKVSARWKEIRSTLAAGIEELKTFKSTIAAAAERNAILWDYRDDGDPNFDFDGYYDNTVAFLENRWRWMDSQLG